MICHIDSGLGSGADMTAKKKPATVLVLRTCHADMTAYGGFKWPRRGKVEAPDWKADDNCGHGLHGLLWGAGDGSLLSWDESARWLVVEVLASDVRTGKGDLIDKCKYPRGTVRYCGDRHGATEYLKAHGLPPGTCVHGGSATAGYRGTATAGDRGVLVIRWRDGNCFNLAVAIVGQNGIKPNVKYRLNDSHEFEEVV